MELTSRLPTSPLPQGASGGTLSTASITFSPPLTDVQKAALANQPLTVVGTGANGTLTLQTPQGQQLTAQLTVPNATVGVALPVVPQGAVLNLLSPPSAPSLSQPLGQSGLSVAIRTLSSTGTTALPTPVQAAQASLTPTLTLALPTSRVALVPVPMPPTSAGQIVVPAGPLAVTLNASPAQLQNSVGQPLTLTITQSPNAAQPTAPQSIILAGTSLPSAPAPSVLTGTLTLGQPLPKGTTLPVTVLAPSQTQPLVIQTQPVMVSVATSSPQIAPGSLLNPAAVRVVVEPPATNTPAPAGLTVARVLPQAASVTTSIVGAVLGQNQASTASTVFQYPILLANGQRGVVQSPVALPEGTTLMVEIPSLTSAPNVVQVVPSGGQGGQPQGGLPGTVSVAPLQTAAPILPVGAVVQGEITGQNPQGQLEMTLSSPPQLAGQTVALTVTASPAESTPTLAMGTQLRVQVQADGTATVLEMHLPAPLEKANTVAQLGQQWAALDKTLQALQQQAPAQAAALQRHLPQLENLLPNFINVINAIRTGNPDDFVGPQLANLLRATHPDVAADIATLKSLQQRPETASGNSPTDAATWRGTLFPYVEGPLDKDPKQGRFFWRREQKDDPRGKSPTRFVMEMTLSGTGPLQLDGLVQFPSVWLKLRRTTPITEDGFTEGLQMLVANLLDAYGLNGGIGVEVTPAFSVNPMKDILAASPDILPTKA